VFDEVGVAVPKPSPSRPLRLEDFLSLSRILTGIENLDAALGREYLNRLTGTTFGAPLRQLMERFRALGKEPTTELVQQQILAEDALRPTVCQIILLWYTSGMQDPKDPMAPTIMHYGTQEEYFSALGWRLIGAHVPGLSGGYFGHWRYRPENEPAETKDEA
jgi:hypothetical protein